MPPPKQGLENSWMRGKNRGLRTLRGGRVTFLLENRRSRSAGGVDFTPGSCGKRRRQGTFFGRCGEAGFDWQEPWRESGGSLPGRNRPASLILLDRHVGARPHGRAPDFKLQESGNAAARYCVNRVFRAIVRRNAADLGVCRAGRFALRRRPRMKSAL